MLIGEKMATSDKLVFAYDKLRPSVRLMNRLSMSLVKYAEFQDKMETYQIQSYPLSD